MRRRAFVRRAAFAGSAVLSLALALVAPAWAPQAVAASDAAATLSRDTERCRTQGNLDACYDAIRWRPRDPALLVALGDALDRANRPAEAARAYRRAVVLAPNAGGAAAKLNAVEAKLASRRLAGTAPTASAAGRAAPGRRFSNADPVAQSH